MVGPLTSVLPWIPFKAHLILARRAIGVSAFLFAVAHMLAYLVPVLMRNWRELYTSGRLWIVGLAVGFAAFVDMGVLAFTSRDKAVAKLVGKKWTRLHKTTYMVLPVVIVHALCVGADFGLNR